MTAGKYLDDLFFVGPLLHRVFREVLEAQRLINMILNTVLVHSLQHQWREF
jgi:hypothetical protein